MTYACRGTVRGNVVILDEDVILPDDTVVDIHVREMPRKDASYIERILTLRAQNPGRIGIDELIAEDRQEREGHADQWIGGSTRTNS